MKNQSNGLVYLLVIAALIILIYAKDMNQMRMMIHLLMISLVIILMIQLMLLPFFKRKQSKKEWNQLHEKIHHHPQYQTLKLKFDEEMGNEQLTIYVDSRHNKWCTVKKGSQELRDDYLQIFDFADILAVNLINEQTFSVKRRDKQQDLNCYKLEVQIQMRHQEGPICLTFINSEVSSQSKYYQRMLHEAKYIQTMLTSMKSQGELEDDLNLTGHII